jgi:hypothetical protein
MPSASCVCNWRGDSRGGAGEEEGSLPGASLAEDGAGGPTSDKDGAGEGTRERRDPLRTREQGDTTALSCTAAKSVGSAGLLPLALLLREAARMVVRRLRGVLNTLAPALKPEAPAAMAAAAAVAEGGRCGGGRCMGGTVSPLAGGARGLRAATMLLSPCSFPEAMRSQTRRS